MIKFSTSMTERRLKRVAIMADQFVGGLLNKEPDFDYIIGYRFEDHIGDLPEGTRVESFHFSYDPASIIVLLSNPTWPEVECGEYPPFLKPGQLAVRQAFVNKEKYAEYTNQSAENWQETAKQHLANEVYYRSLLVKIGGLFGMLAFTDDEGKIQDEMLVAKVPDLCHSAFEKNIQIPVLKAGELDWNDLQQLKTMRDRINEAIYDKENGK